MIRIQNKGKKVRHNKTVKRTTQVQVNICEDVGIFITGLCFWNKMLEVQNETMYQPSNLTLFLFPMQITQHKKLHLNVDNNQNHLDHVFAILQYSSPLIPFWLCTCHAMLAGTSQKLVWSCVNSMVHVEPLSISMTIHNLDKQNLISFHNLESTL